MDTGKEGYDSVGGGERHHWERLKKRSLSSFEKGNLVCISKTSCTQSWKGNHYRRRGTLNWGGKGGGGTLQKKSATDFGGGGEGDPVKTKAKKTASKERSPWGNAADAPLCHLKKKGGGE